MKSHVLGFPRIGTNRELKKALESYWRKEIDSNDLTDSSQQIKALNWQIQKDAGLDYVATGDFSFYDHILDTTAMLGLIPKRFEFSKDLIDLETYFNMARGDKEKNIPAMIMKKWFNTNYHYIVPEFEEGMKPSNLSLKIVEETKEAFDKGFSPKPVLVGPFTYLLLGIETGNLSRFDLLEDIVEIYCKVVKDLSKYSDIIQIDEPILCTKLDIDIKDKFLVTYKKLKESCGSKKIMLATYFDKLKENQDFILNSEIDILHLDITNSGDEVFEIANKLPSKIGLSLGLVNGRNIWINDLEKSLEKINNIKKDKEFEIYISSSCSLLHCPVDVENETLIDENIKKLLSFAKQKTKEVSFISKALSVDVDEDFLTLNRENILSRKKNKEIYVKQVRDRVNSLTDDMFSRKSSFDKRIKLQKKELNLPLFPVTTIGSFPQTSEIRKTRQKFKKGEIDQADYVEFMKNNIKEVIDFQNKWDIDVLVHGEPERNDMVEYFGENLEGFCFTKNGWVQSYGSRCVKPPIIYGDVWRKDPITLKWINYANSLTDKIVKGMLTGPVTILCWSFERDDIPKSDVCKQIALAIRDEVIDLEKTGTKIIQIDEAALREGLPLRKSDYNEYLTWAVDSFCLCASGVKDETQIHTHMCYSEFNSIVEWIAKMDADVISIESSRSKMTLLNAFEEFNYPNEIGPGVYDIHSPRIPKTEEMVDLLKDALKVIEKEKLWVNPDCGLKTRGWPETEKSLLNLVEAANILRKEMTTN